MASVPGLVEELLELRPAPEPLFHVFVERAERSRAPRSTVAMSDQPAPANAAGEAGSEIVCTTMDSAANRKPKVGGLSEDRNRELGTGERGANCERLADGCPQGPRLELVPPAAPSAFDQRPARATSRPCPFPDPVTRSRSQLLSPQQPVPVSATEPQRRACHERHFVSPCHSGRISRMRSRFTIADRWMRVNCAGSSWRSSSDIVVRI